MKYGITGNTNKDRLWEPVASLVTWFVQHNIPYRLNANVACGLQERNLVPASLCRQSDETELAASVDILLSFGGDGAMLRSAHEVGTLGTPILGVNIGRLGFLADVEVDQVQETIRRLENGDYAIHSRLALAVDIEDEDDPEHLWALNDVAIERGGPIGLIAIEVTVDGTFLNTYWADGLIVSTPTGSTAYSLAVGGPIVVPDSDVIILSPIAPHSLTVRPVVLPASSILKMRVVGSRQSYLLAADGISTHPRKDPVTITIRRADHRVNLVKLPEQHYFQTLRSKLTWGGGTRS